MNPAGVYPVKKIMLDLRPLSVGNFFEPRFAGLARYCAGVWPRCNRGEITGPNLNCALCNAAVDAGASSPCTVLVRMAVFNARHADSLAIIIQGAGRYKDFSRESMLALFVLALQTQVNCNKTARSA